MRAPSNIAAAELEGLMPRAAGERARIEVSRGELAEASVWVARLHAGGRDQSVRNAFRRWLLHDAGNARAFELVTEVWEDAGGLRRVVAFSTVERRRRTRWVASVGAAFAVVITLVGGIALHMHEDVFVTAIGEQRQVTLRDGSRIFLNTASRIVVDYVDEARRVDVTRGEILFEVAKRPDWPFIVTAGERQVTALGTAFIIRDEGQRLAVTLIEGRVVVADSPMDGARTLLSGTAYTLEPGQRVIFATGRRPAIDKPSIEQSTAWRRGQVALNNTPLAMAAEEMNRYSTLKEIVVQPEVGQLLVNGLFQAGDSGSFAAAVAQAYGLQMREHEHEIVLGPVRFRREAAPLQL